MQHAPKILCYTDRCGASHVYQYWCTIIPTTGPLPCTLMSRLLLHEAWWSAICCVVTLSFWFFVFPLSLIPKAVQPRSDSKVRYSVMRNRAAVKGPRPGGTHIN